MAHEHPSRVSAHRGRCPGHAELLLAVDAELGPVDEAAADVALDALAWRLMPADPDPREDLRRIAGLTAPGGPLRVSPTGSLRLSEALAGATGHPLVAAVAMVEAGRRAGMHAGIVGGDGVLLVAHHHLREPLVVDPRAGARGVGGVVVDACAGARGSDLRWCCAHQSTCVVLDAVVEDAHRRGDVTRALRAAELRLDLPFDEETLARRREDVARVRARLN